MAELIRLDRPPADFAISVSGISPSLEITKLETYLRRHVPSHVEMLVAAGILDP